MNSRAVKTTFLSVHLVSSQLKRCGLPRVFVSTTGRKSNSWLLRNWGPLPRRLVTSEKTELHALELAANSRLPPATVIPAVLLVPPSVATRKGLLMQIFRKQLSAVMLNSPARKQVAKMQFPSTTSQLLIRIGLLQSSVFHQSANVGRGGLVVPEACGLRHFFQLKPPEMFLTSHKRTRSPSKTQLRYHDMHLYVCQRIEITFCFVKAPH